MFFHAFSEGTQSLFRFYQIFDTFGWWWWWFTEDVVQNPLAPFDRRGPGWIGSDQQDACLSKDSTTVRIQRDPAKLVPFDSLEPIMLRQRFVDVRKIGGQEVKDASILVQY